MFSRVVRSVRDFLDGWKAGRRRYESQADAFVNSGHGEGYCYKCDSGSCITVGESPSGMLYMECVKCGTVYDYDVGEDDPEDVEEYAKLFECSDVLSQNLGVEHERSDL